MLLFTSFWPTLACTITITLTFDVPLGTHFDVLVPVGTILRALWFEVVISCFAYCHFEIIELWRVSHNFPVDLIMFSLFAATTAKTRATFITTASIVAFFCKVIILNGAFDFLECCRQWHVELSVNSITAIRVPAGMKNSFPIGFLQ